MFLVSLHLQEWLLFSQHLDNTYQCDLADELLHILSSALPSELVEQNK